MSLLEDLQAALGERLIQDEAVLDAHRHDSWALSQIRVQRGDPPPRPLAVVAAGSVEDVQTTLRLCHAAGASVVPFGAGSGVVGGVSTSADQVVLSTAKLSGLIALSDQDLTATFWAGTKGDVAEAICQEAGLTIGHWPQSIALSSVGGWVATRASGQLSTGYGNIEEIVLDLEVVLPDGRRMSTRRAPRAAAGPDLRHLFLGSEGTMGIITAVTFSLRALPESTRGQAFHFASLGAGLEAIRRIIRAGWRPPAVRLYDAAEARRQFDTWCPDGRHLLLLLHEGPTGLVDAHEAGCAALCDDGEPADAAAVTHWLSQRNHVPTLGQLSAIGLVVDTIEVSATWQRIGAVYEAVKATLSEVPELVAVSAHASHAYRSGVNLYFTFVAQPSERAQMERVYTECWDRTMAATAAAGGSISHHHGIGRVRRGFLVEELGEVGVDVLRAVKAALDPAGRLNPGVLIP